jgi:hypothetical protein
MSSVIEELPNSYCILFKEVVDDGVQQNERVNQAKEAGSGKLESTQKVIERKFGMMDGGSFSSSSREHSVLV